MTCRDPSWGSDLKFMDRFGNARLIKVTFWRDKLQPDQSENFSVFLCVFRDKPAARPRTGSWSVWRGARLGRVGVTPGHVSIAASLLLCQWDRWAVSMRPAAGSALLLAEMRHQWSMWVKCSACQEVKLPTQKSVKVWVQVLVPATLEEEDQFHFNADTMTVLVLVGLLRVTEPSKL